MAHSIYQAGYLNVRQVAEASVENIQKIPGYEELELATKIKERAQSVVEKAGDVLAITPAGDDKGSFTAAPIASRGDAKAQAEERLREMMKQAGAEPAEAVTAAAKRDEKPKE